MSIVNDFADINRRLRGDDWWKPEVVAVEAPATVEREYVRPDLCEPVPVRNGSCGITTAAEARKALDRTPLDQMPALLGRVMRAALSDILEEIPRGWHGQIEPDMEGLRFTKDGKSFYITRHEVEDCVHLRHAADLVAEMTPAMMDVILAGAKDD